MTPEAEEDTEGEAQVEAEGEPHGKPEGAGGPKGASTIFKAERPPAVSHESSFGAAKEGVEK